MSDQANSGVSREFRLDRLTNRLVDRRSASASKRRFSVSRMPRAVRELIVKDLRTEKVIEPDMAQDPRYVGARVRHSQECRETLGFLERADTLPDDIPRELRHHIADPCLIEAHKIRRRPSYRPLFSRQARFARQLYRLGTFFEVAERNEEGRLQ